MNPAYDLIFQALRYQESECTNPVEMHHIRKCMDHLITANTERFDKEQQAREQMAIAIQN